ncbi:MAG TPA: ATP-dependent DNA helicase [Acidobacteriota bacterium]|nr:ATP-dependent DNA helicase [Acidobacteriota bacterium]
MARAVLSAIRERYPLCIEAGTGTGKTLAYLIPVVFSQKRVIISTATKNLQEQLFQKDVPFVRKHLFPDIRATYMKGRQNYICLRLLEQQGRQKSIVASGSLDAHRSLTKWVRKTNTGDRAELEWLSDRDPLWDALDARSERCVGQKCEHFEECYVTRMRQKAIESDVVVLNHALLFSSLALETDEIGSVLPDCPVLILDEAHEVEDVASDYFGSRLSNHQIQDFCRDLEKAFSTNVDVSRLANSLARASDDFFSSFPGQEGKHSLNFFRDVTGASTDLRFDLGQKSTRLKEGLLSVYHHLELEESRSGETGTLVRRLGRLLGSLDEIFDTDDPGNVYWFDRSRRGTSIHVNPINVAPALRETVFSRFDTTILTSATLTTEGNFTYFRKRLGVPEPEELIVPGEFDYRKQALLYVPKALPDPRAPERFPRLLEEVSTILLATQGAAFVLCTSYQQMTQLYETLGETLQFPLMCQGGKPKSQLLEDFKRTPNAVLFATSSFWQGVDVQGDALRAVIIDKLPFQVPTEPVVAARLNQLQREKRNPFMEYSVPAAIISLRQGLGRLIRSREDTGILAILDSRLWTRAYGKQFFHSLPNCPITDNIEDLRNFFC